MFPCVNAKGFTHKVWTFAGLVDLKVDGCFKNFNKMTKNIHKLLHWVNLKDSDVQIRDAEIQDLNFSSDLK